VNVLGDGVNRPQSGHSIKQKKANKATLNTVEKCGACTTIILSYILTHLNGVLTLKYRTKIEVREKKKYKNFKQNNSLAFRTAKNVGR
jgi:hypothetical protein